MEYNIEIKVNGVVRIQDHNFIQPDKESLANRSAVSAFKTLPFGGGTLIYKLQNFGTGWLQTILYEDDYKIGTKIFNITNTATQTLYTFTIDSGKRYYPTLLFSKTYFPSFIKNYTI